MPHLYPALASRPRYRRRQECPILLAPPRRHRIIALVPPEQELRRNRQLENKFVANAAVKRIADSQ